MLASPPPPLQNVPTLHCTCLTTIDQTFDGREALQAPRGLKYVDNGLDSEANDVFFYYILYVAYFWIAQNENSGLSRQLSA